MMRLRYDTDDDWEVEVGGHVVILGAQAEPGIGRVKVQIRAPRTVEIHIQEEA
jgi:sRNA-binding carbon storage regulator CsrA